MNYITKDQFGSKFSVPGFYRIAVFGKLPKTLSEKLYGMNIFHVNCKENEISIIKGNLPDQAALSGVLNSLYEMHMTVLAVKRLRSVK